MIAVHANLLPDVSWLGWTDNWVQQQIAASLLGCQLGQLDVSLVQGVASLEGHNLVPTQLFESLFKLLWASSLLKVVIVDVLLHEFEVSSNLDVFDVLGEVVPLGVVLVASLSVLELKLFVGVLDVFDVEVALGAAVEVEYLDQADLLDFLGLFAGHVELDRQRPEAAVWQSEVLADRLISLLVHEPVEGSEGPGVDHLHVAELSEGRLDRNSWLSVLAERSGYHVS